MKAKKITIGERMFFGIKSLRELIISEKGFPIDVFLTNPERVRFIEGGIRGLRVIANNGSSIMLSISIPVMAEIKDFCFAEYIAGRYSKIISFVGYC